MQISMSLFFTIMLLFLGSFSQKAFGQNCDCPASTNLLSNPDFSLGDAGFDSDLDFEDYCDGSSYDVGNEGRDKCDTPIWIDDTWDHTVGTSAGSYMIVNGPSYDIPPNIIWRQNVGVDAGETYTFYFHVLPKLTDLPPPDGSLTLAFYVNGTNVSGNLTMPYITNWLCYNFEWTATSTGPVTLQIRQVEHFGSMAYDYGIDDVYFGKCEEIVQPCAVSANWTYNISPNDCEVMFYNLSTVGAGTTIVSYHWDFGDGNTSTEANPTHFYDGPGVYEVCLTIYGVDENGECCTSKICGFVQSDCHPQPCAANIYYIVYSINDPTDCLIQFSASADPNREVLGWYWNFGDGETGTGENPVHDYAGGGTYTVCVTMILEDGDQCCTETFCTEISFSCIDLPDTFIAPTTDAEAQSEKDQNPAAQRRTTAASELQIFPNPSKAWVAIQFAAQQSASYDLQVFDLQGKLILSHSAKANEGINREELDISQLTAGTYILNVRLKDKVLSQKLVVL